MRDESLLRMPLQTLLRRLRDVAKSEGIEFLVTDTLRNRTEQNALYAQGRTKPGKIVTNTPYPQSLHNHGVAFDIVPLKDGKPNYSDSKAYQRLGMLGKSLGLEWGGDWASFPDRPHFQLTEGKTWKDFVNGYELKWKDNSVKIKELEDRLRVEMDTVNKNLQIANATRKDLCLAKGISIKQYSIKDE